MNLKKSFQTSIRFINSEAEELLPKIEALQKAKFTHAEIYKAGVEQLTDMIKKAKKIV